MADQQHLAVLKQGVAAWNAWRRQHPEILPDLSEADLSEADLSGADLRHANFMRANLSHAYLSEASLDEANLREADLTGAISGRSSSYELISDMRVSDMPI